MTLRWLSALSIGSGVKSAPVYHILIMRHRVGAPLWSPCGGMVDATPRWCSAVEPMRWDGGCDTALVFRCGAHAVGWPILRKYKYTAVPRLVLPRLIKIAAASVPVSDHGPERPHIQYLGSELQYSVQYCIYLVQYTNQALRNGRL